MTQKSTATPEFKHKPEPKQWPQHYHKFRNNVFRNIAIASHEFNTQLLTKLNEKGYKNVKHHYIKVIPFLGPKGVRPIDLAQLQGISKQRIGYLINEIEDMGYLIKKADNTDSRSKRLFVTPKGIRLVKDAIAISADIENSMAQIVGKRNFKAFTKAIEQAFKAMDLSYPAIKQVSDIWHINAGSRLPAYFNAITKKVDKTIAEKNAAGGFIDLNQSYKVIIGNMDKEGVRIADIAKAEGMSKQAVSLLAIKTIDAGYIEKSSNPNDARSQKLMLTEKGMRVIILSMKNLVVMEKELSLKIGHRNFQQLMTQSIRLANYYGPEPLKSKTSPTSSSKTERSTSSRSPHTEEPHSVSALIDNWAKQLYALVQDNEDIAMAEVFVQADGRRILRSEVMYYLSNIADFK